jgi:hypothetical protein
MWALKMCSRIRSSDTRVTNRPTMARASRVPPVTFAKFLSVGESSAR